MFCASVVAFQIFLNPCDSALCMHTRTVPAQPSHVFRVRSSRGLLSLLGRTPDDPTGFPPLQPPCFPFSSLQLFTPSKAFLPLPFFFFFFNPTQRNGGDVSGVPKEIHSFRQCPVSDPTTISQCVFVVCTTC